MHQVVNFRKDSLIPWLVNVDRRLKEKLTQEIFQLRLSVGTSTWFWNRMKALQALEFLNLIDEESNITKMAQSLVYAYQNPCTLDSLVRILRAIFGDASTITIEEQQGSISVHIVIDSENALFYRDWKTLQGTPLITKAKTPLHFIKTDALGFLGDLKSFLRLFVATGVVLDEVSTKNTRDIPTTKENL